MTARFQEKNWGIVCSFNHTENGRTGLNLLQCPIPTHSVPPVPSLMVAITSFIIPGYMFLCCCAVTKLCLTLWHHELQNARLPCLSLSYRVCSNSCPLSWWCHPTISSSVAPFSCPQSSETLGLGEVKRTSSKKGTGQGVPFLLQGTGEAGLVSAGLPWSCPSFSIWGRSSLLEAPGTPSILDKCRETHT